MTAQHILIVPPVGLLEVVHADHDVDIEGTLRARTEGILVHLSVERVHVFWMHQDAGTINPRARAVLAELSGAEVVFTGHVLFTGINETKMGEIVANLSLR